jgi:hypothetical protein
VIDNTDNEKQLPNLPMMACGLLLRNEVRCSLLSEKCDNTITITLMYKENMHASLTYDGIIGMFMFVKLQRYQCE